MSWLSPDYNNTPVSAGRPAFSYSPAGSSEPPAVTIITPYYNTGAMFLETADAVLRQSLQQCEWLIVNDGSDDAEALRILEPFRGRDPRIRVIDLPTNQGLPAARNAGLRQACAGCVFFLDSDDLIEPTTLEKLAWHLDCHPEYGFCKGLTVAFGAQQYVSPIGFEAIDPFLIRNQVTIAAMVRREVALRVGGFDESLRKGLEDWDFWLRCASQGVWGGTVREPMDWFRRRTSHSDRWPAWTGRGEGDMRRELRRRYRALYASGLPRIAPQPQRPYTDVPEHLPFANRLTKSGRRLLFVIPWMAMGGADRFNLDLIGQLRARGTEVSVATTLPDNYSWEQEFARLTPDLFVLPRFLRLHDYPRFLRYLIQSRQIDVVLLSNSELGYRFLPYLRAHCPETAFVDLCHMEEEHWNNGGHPRQAVAYQSVLDLNLVSSLHLKDWMVGRGADPERIEICTTNIDTDAFAPEPALGAAVRSELGIAAGVPVILYAARLCDQKQPRMFAAVMEELRARKVRFVCLVAGDGPDRRWLSSYLRRHRLGRQVRMLGAVSSQRMRALLAASDLFFLPSRMEGISVAIYEAMAMGVVPVSADVGGQRELVTPECGVLIRPGKSEVTAYADALEGLLRSPALRSSLGQAARTRVCSQFRLEQMGERMAALLEVAEHSRRSRPRPWADPRLGKEHAVQAIEHQRILRAAGFLWKYQSLEAVRRRLGGVLAPGARRLAALQWRLQGILGPMRRAKDAIWIAGHRVRVRMRRDSSLHAK